MLARVLARAFTGFSGTIPGLLGKDAAFAKRGDDGNGNGRARGHDEQVAYGPLIDDSAGRLALPASFTSISSARPRAARCSSSRATWTPARGVHRTELLHGQKFLFANVQVPGRVFAIQGPFRKQR